MKLNQYLNSKLALAGALLGVVVCVGSSCGDAGHQEAMAQERERYKAIGATRGSANIVRTKYVESNDVLVTGEYLAIQCEGGVRFVRLGNKEELIEDGWGRALKVSVNETGVNVLSRGEDGIEGTEDDQEFRLPATLRREN
ncbi:hypothetical protein [Sulfuriroseicoccus oceanibius]|uniref:Lipoprotein n=1 Tax=Sulfuriroseicoccus oceanibius TaxID=2707525 RepID=A0A7T7F1X5_9BACT|nr:hypothetical protein [Sulfuriroseicoccus oceanibius]QQL45276.1 hypothetical protein G3M56_001435 [Sulfuriroseicoccus oceanibius]